MIIQKNYSDKILPEFTIYKHLPSNIKIDDGSCFLLPKEYKKLICGTSTADGNCLFHSASIILYGNESQFIQLRLAVIIELMKNARRYLEIEAFETDITYANVIIQLMLLIHGLKKKKITYKNLFVFYYIYLFIFLWCIFITIK